MLTPNARVLGGEHHRQQIQFQNRFRRSRERRAPFRAWCNRQAPPQAVNEVGVLEGLEIVVREVDEP